MPTIGRQRIREYLNRHGGEVVSDSGFGLTQQIADELGYKLDSLGRVLKDMEDAGEIVRDVRGKRTYRIALGGGKRTQDVRLSTVNKLVNERNRLEARLEAINGELLELVEDLAGSTPEEILKKLVGPGGA